MNGGRQRRLKFHFTCIISMTHANVLGRKKFGIRGIGNNTKKIRTTRISHFLVLILRDDWECERVSHNADAKIDDVNEWSDRKMHSNMIQCHQFWKQFFFTTVMIVVFSLFGFATGTDVYFTAQLLALWQNGLGNGHYTSHSISGRFNTR